MPAFDFIEEPQDEILSEDEFDFIPEEPIQQPTIPRLQPGATLADVLRQPPLVTPPWEGGVVRSVLPGVLQPEDLLPAVRKIGGAIAEGEPEDTHPDIITREQIPAIEIDQRGFTGPDGQFLDREAAAQATGIPTMREPGRLHSTDLSAFQEPGGFEAQLEAAKEIPEPLIKLTEVPESIKEAYSAPVRAIFGDKAADVEVAAADALYKAAKSVPEFLTTEEGMLSLLASLIPAGRAGVTAFFTVDQAKSVLDQAKDIGGKWDEMTAPQKAAAVTQAAASLGFTAMLAKAGAGEVARIAGKPTAAPVPEAKPEPPVIPEEAPPVRTLTPAIRLPDGRIFRGPAHKDIFIKVARETGEPELLAEASKPQNQGFVNEKGEFKSRSEASPIFKELTGKEPADVGSLKSEDFSGFEHLFDFGEKKPQLAPWEQPLYYGDFAGTVKDRLFVSKFGDYGKGTYVTPNPKFAKTFAEGTAFGKSGGSGKVHHVEVEPPKRVLSADDTPLTPEEIKHWENDGFDMDGIRTRKDLIEEQGGRTVGREDLRGQSEAWDDFLNKFGYDAVFDGEQLMLRKGTAKVKSGPVTKAIEPINPSIGAGIQAALMRKSEAGAVPIPKDLSDLVTKSRDTIRTLAKTKDVRSTMTYTKDVAGNTATVYGQRVGNNIRGELKRAMGRDKANPLDEQALTFVRESNGDRSQLAVMRSKLSASTAANPKWKAAAIKAIDHAEANWDRMNPIAAQYENATHSQIVGENSAGINTVERPGYVMHAQDVPNEFGFFSDVSGEGGAGFKHIRTHNTLADSIAAGVDPKSINAVTLLTQRVARGQMLINNRMWVEGLRGTTDPLTRKPVVTNPEVISRGAGLPPDTRAPEGYVTEIAGGRPIAILKPYAGIFRSLTEPSKFSESLGWNATLKAATTGKHIALLLDTFHLGRIAFWESIIKPLSLTDPKAPLPSYRKGILTLDYTPQELQRMAASGEIKQGALNDILAAKREVDGLIKHGYNVAKISDVLHQEWLQKIPITGTFNKWLFNQFQRGAMAEVGSLEAGRYRRMHPSWSDEKVYREVAKDLNTRFGNLGRQGILRSRTAQDTGRLLFLAPQWNEGLIRSEIGAVTGTVKGVASSLKEKRLSFGVLPRAIGTMMVGQFAANQIINYITRGHPTWQNPEEGLGAKLSAWVPDVVGGGPGFFLHPFGLAAEITHLLTQKYEKTADARNAILGFMGGRWSTLARPLMTFLTRRDVFQRLIRPEDIWKETAKAGVPLPIGASAAVPAIKERLMGEKKESFPGQYQKQMMASVGIKTDQAPSPTQRMLKLAGDFKKELGVKEGGEFYVSAYAPLRDALRRGALEEARKAYEDLIKQARTPKQIEAAVRPWTGGTVNPNTLEVTPKHYKPITGSAKHERMFLKTLNPEQRNTYLEARKEREQLYRTFRDMLRQTGP